MLRRILIGIVTFYQRALSPLTPPSCRYVPSCSEYARVALEQHGALRGGWLALRRLVRCNPFGGSGWDPVPPPGGSREAAGHGRAPTPPIDRAAAGSARPARRDAPSGRWERR